MKRKREIFASTNGLGCKSVLLTALVLLLLVFLLPLWLLLGSPQQQARASSAPVPSAEEGSGSAVPAETAEASSEALPPPEEAEKSISEAEQTPEPPADSAADRSAQADVPTSLDGSVTLTVLVDGTVHRATLDNYLWGVVAAEMPAAFHQQALCAQAVAARTYTLYRMACPSENHPDVDICSDPGCCQAWISRTERLKDWDKDSSAEYAKKITKAVQSTDGLALYYGGTPILAAFHAASAGSTKSALEVWGEDIPYLQEVSSPEDDRSVPNYYSTLTVSAEEFRDIFTEAYPKADLRAENCADWFGSLTYDEAGLPTTIEIGSLTVDTGAVRTLFGLRSASFSVECQGDKITFYVTGYGHGVGMSQYGANALAKGGKSAREILEWYYSGARLQKMELPS